MPNTLEIECAGCGALYRVLARSPDVTVLFRCIHCEEHSVYHLGQVRGLNRQIMAAAPDDVRQEHVRQRMEDCALDALAGVRQQLARIVNINADVEFAPPRQPLEPLDATDADPAPREDATMMDDGVTPKGRVSGHAGHAPPPDPITDHEARAFLASLDDPDFWTRWNSA